ncbi:MAG: DNA polymerase II large subunit [Candidatus Thorarchaeota archaeon]
MTESELNLPKHSVSYAQYFEALSNEVESIYRVAGEARSKGYDPTTKVEIPPAHDVAARVEVTLQGPVGVAKRIRELSEKYKTREEVAFAVAKDIALGELGNFDHPEKAADKAVRVALAIMTESITAAPIEGIAKVQIRGSGDDRYLALYLAGPIRAAGGTETAMTVLVADHVRQLLGLPAYVATEREVERALEEVELYARNVHLQYPVQPELVRLVASKLPIMLTGEPTEEFEVTGSRDLDPRIETNRVRGGAVLVLSDGLVGRATKLAKTVSEMSIKGWEWLEDVAAKMSKVLPSESDTMVDKKLEPKSDYLTDVIGGRPVFSHPSRLGGFRLRYGRSRNTGLAGVGVHPATMLLVDEFLATGTHIRTERPGKGSIVAPVDTIEGPIVLLRDGSLRQVFTVEEARKLQGKVDRIVYLGDILVGLGEFLENNHPLVPSGYCEEWWSHDLERAYSGLSNKQIEKLLADVNIDSDAIDAFIESPLKRIPSPEEAIAISEKFSTPLHPRYLYRWPALDLQEMLDIRSWLLTKHRMEKTEDGDRISLPKEERYKTLLEKLGIPHELSDGGKRIRLTDSPVTILAQLGEKSATAAGSNSLDALNTCSFVELRNKVGISIGARMGRPEKAEERKMRPPVQVLFPVGRTLASERRMEKVAKSTQQSLRLDAFDTDTGELLPLPEDTGVMLELVSRECPHCENETFESRCPLCGTHTDLHKVCLEDGCGKSVDASTGECPFGHRTTKIVPVNIQELLDRVKEEIEEPQSYNLRAVLGLTSNLKIPEYLGKGILRAKHDVYCYRDGTARFDVTDAPLTHFRPLEVGVSVSKLRELGYTNDYQGAPLVSDLQTVELKVQDLIVPENCADYMVRVGKFVDDCLERIYELPRHYNFNLLEDAIGQLVIGLAPHTSAGIIGRIAGFTNASVCYAHPYWHAAKRRNCDGDEDALILVLDALINFSKEYLPAGRGGFMDAPLVLSVVLNPEEVDDESHNIEVCHRYPAEFYEMVAEAQHPKAVKELVDIVQFRLGTEAQYEGFGFTHDTSSIDAGPRNTRYKILGSMHEKLEAQLDLAVLIDAVDSRDVAERVLSHHFIRDIRGNLRAYSTQKFRCRKCNRIYRRIPMSGRCVCADDREQDEPSTLLLTVSQKNISKYLGVAEKMIRDHDLSQYLKQRLTLMNSALDSLFVSDQTSLMDFMKE